MTRTLFKAAFIAALLSSTAFTAASARDLQRELDEIHSGQAVGEPPPIMGDEASRIDISAQSTYGEGMPQPGYDNGIQLVSGGVADSGMDDISAVQNHYDLKLVFADTTGAYLADVGVQVLDRQGNTLVNADSTGPVMLMRLQPGTYTVNSTISGVSRTNQIRVSGHGLKSYIVHLPAQES